MVTTLNLWPIREADMWTVGVIGIYLTKIK